MVAWRKSSYSASQQACVEIGRGVGIRDSKTAGQLPVSAAAWSEFLAAVKAEQLVGAWSPRDSTRRRV